MAMADEHHVSGSKVGTSAWSVSTPRASVRCRAWPSILLQHPASDSCAKTVGSGGLLEVKIPKDPASPPEQLPQTPYPSPSQEAFG